MRFFISISILCCSLFALTVQAQENAWEDLLKKEVEVLNPVYKPVVGFGVTTFSFRGDIKNNKSYPMMGKLGYKLNVHTHLDPKRYFKGNFFLYLNQITVNQRSFSTPMLNSNFRSDLIIFGVSIQYDFGHFIKSEIVRPFIAAGFETILFNSKGDFKTGNATYNYWNDGSIRNGPAGSSSDSVIYRDYTYETDLRKDNVRQGFKNYSNNAFGIPVEVGFDLHVSSRCFICTSLAYHYTFSDYIDNVSYKNTPIVGNKKTDKLISANITVHLDLFSDPKTRIQNMLFADMDFDYTIYSDEDNDMIFDGWDKCPGTPANVTVDTTGCPFDADQDRVPDYNDKQANTTPGVIVDLNGVEITQDTVIYFFNKYSGVNRSDVDLYLKLYEQQTPRFKRKPGEIPAKFKSIDTNGDKYISYEETLKTIDSFYEFETDLKYQDIEELIEFFFSQ